MAKAQFRREAKETMPQYSRDSKPGVQKLYKNLEATSIF
jgi:hypothetical protein